MSMHADAWCHTNATPPAHHGPTQRRSDVNRIWHVWLLKSTLLYAVLLSLIAVFESTASAIFSGSITLTAPLGGTNCTWQDDVALIGTIYSSAGAFEPYSQSAIIVDQMYINGVNAQCGIGSLGIEARIIGCDIRSNSSLIAGCIDELAAQNLTALLLPEGPYAAIAASLGQTLMGDIPMVAGLSGTTSVFQTSAGKRVYGNVFGVMTPAAKYMAQFVSIMKINGYSTVAIVSEAEDPLSPNVDVCTGAKTYITDTSMTLVYETFMPLYGATDANVTSSIYDAMSAAKAAKPDVLITCLSVYCDTVFDAMVDLDFNPSSHGLFECLNEFDTYPATLPAAQYAFGPVTWDVSLRGDEYQDQDSTVRNYANLFPPTSNATSAQRFMKVYRQTSRSLTSDHSVVAATSLTASQMAALYRIDYAIAFADGSLKGSELVLSMQSMNCNSFFGIISTGPTGQNENRNIPQLQIIGTDGSYQIVYPLLSLSILPMPTFEQRVYRADVFGTAAEQVMLALAAVLTVCAGVLAFLIVAFRRRRGIKALSLPFSLLYLAGCVVLAWAPASWSLTATSSQCTARVPVWLAAFVLLVGPITITAWRIDTIFTRSQLHVRRLTDLRTACVLAAASMPFVLCAVLALGFNDLVPVVVVPDPYRPSFDYTQCATRGSGIGAVVAVAYSTIPCIFAGLAIMSYFAVRVRKIPPSLDLLNNAKLLSILVFLFVVIIFLGAMIQFVLPDSASNRYTKFVLMFILTDVLALNCLTLYFFDPVAALFVCRRGASRDRAMAVQRRPQRREVNVYDVSVVDKASTSPPAVVRERSSPSPTGPSASPIGVPGNQDSTRRS